MKNDMTTKARRHNVNVQCAMCDEWYDPNGDRAIQHLHEEPQGGIWRDIWLNSEMPYDEWKLTPWGRAYLAYLNAKREGYKR